MISTPTIVVVGDGEVIREICAQIMDHVSFRPHTSPSFYTPNEGLSLQVSDHIDNSNQLHQHGKSATTTSQFCDYTVAEAIKMHGLLLSIAIFTACATAGETHHEFRVWAGRQCNDRGDERGYIRIDPDVASESGCQRVPDGAHVFSFENVPDYFHCVGYVYNNPQCNGQRIGSLDGTMKNQRCGTTDGIGSIYGVKVICSGKPW
ncbi:hypothetical protein EJ03DRAFT_54100 [Teratosphaeria nubilosa]|uniref:Uncharacterized protein n=1 Tax=Teratosphaeria nubilosa TaxID=161662 RepID=A0A6G1KTW4_9PEZI|nr:hypothetical protein EJ03DRAFT_54100 [Teratosphaeria nubilosa]